MRKVILIILTVVFVFGMLACQKKNDVVINSAADLAGKKIGCQTGTTGELYIQEGVRNAKLKSFKTGIDASLDLKNGAIDAIVLDELPAKEIVRRNPSLTIVNDNFKTESYAVAVKKGNTELLESINKTIADLKSNGKYEELVKNFMPVDGNVVIPEIDELDTKDIIKMGTNAAFPPFEFIMGTEIVGFDVAIGKLIAKNYGKKLKIIDMSFDGLIAALQSGAVDFVAAGMTETEERKQNVDFSESYYESNQVIIVRKTVQ